MRILYGWTMKLVYTYGFCRRTNHVPDRTRSTHARIGSKQATATTSGPVSGRATTTCLFSRIDTGPVAVALTERNNYMRRAYKYLYLRTPVPLIPVPLSYADSVWYAGPVGTGEERHAIAPRPRRSRRNSVARKLRDGSWQTRYRMKRAWWSCATGP